MRHIRDAATSLILFSEILVACGFTLMVGHTRFSDWTIVLWQFLIPSWIILTIPFWIRDIVKRSTRKQAAFAILVALPSLLLDAWILRWGRI